MHKGSKRCQLRAQELAMRVVLDVQEHVKRHPDFFISGVAAVIHEKYGISQSSARRLVREALDVLGIAYVPLLERSEQFGELLSMRKAEARTCRSHAGGNHVA